MTRALIFVATCCGLLCFALTTSAATYYEPPVHVKRLTLETMSPSLRTMEYAVRGKVVIAADKIKEELKQGSTHYPFDRIIFSNIGNPHQMGQKPLTWPRQVLALTDLPADLGVNHPEVSKMFPSDAVKRAKEIKDGLGVGGTGAYSHSQGCRFLREDVAKFIKHRDGGVPCDPDNLFLTNGASAAIQLLLKALIVPERKTGVMIPIPQYPIYSATVDLFEGQKVGYNLDEEAEWGLNMAELERVYHDAVQSGIDVSCFVLINPGNPTGQVLSRQNVEDIVKFCAKHNLLLIADEVYQENIYDPLAKFVSCKRAAYDTGLLQDDALELVSLHSTSKGVMGECGRRGGYMELSGIDQKVKDQLYKLASSGLCSTLSGQIMTSLMVRGPDPGDESYESHEAEKKAIFDSLKKRAGVVQDGLNSIPGFSCQPAAGSMYCFPEVKMPPGLIQHAAALGVTPDTFYCVSLLEHTGICVVPASGFGQRRGRWGFRTTFLPNEKDCQIMLNGIRHHHDIIMKEFGE